MNITIQAAPLPTNFRGTPQQLLEAFLDRMEITVDGSSFVVSDVQPSGNEGPWLKGGTQWWVWDPGLSSYVPLDVSASVTQQIFIGDKANGPPDPTKYQIWLQLNGSAVVGLFYFAGATIGWVTQAKELVQGAVAPNMLAPQNPGSLITFDLNSQPTILAPGTPGQFLQSTGNSLIYTTPSFTRGVPVFIIPVTLATVPNDSAVVWTTISGLQANGVPLTASATILGISIKGNSAPTISGLSMRADANHPTYLLAQTVRAGSGNASSAGFNQGIYPFTQSSGISSFDYESDAQLGGSKIVLLGYLS